MIQHLATACRGKETQQLSHVQAQQQLHRHQGTLSNKSGYARFSSLDLIDALFILFSPGCVRRKGDSSQVCPLASFQNAFLLDPGRTCSGPAPFLAESYSAASAGYNDCSELQMQALLLAQ